MTEWMVTIDTSDGVAQGEEVLLAFMAALDAIRGMTGTGTSLDIEAGVLSATFAVSAVDSTLHVDAESTDDRAPIPA